MIINTEKFKPICSTILAALDNNELSVITEALELKAVNKKLYLSITNGEYYVSVNLDLDFEDTFNAVVNANVFLKLVAATTSNSIELKVEENCLVVKGNGIYKIPLIFVDSKLLTLPKIIIQNKTVETTLSKDILDSILKYNSKELLKGTILKPVQRLFYVDEAGCITFTTGACVNNFTLDTPFKILLNSRIVKLFKLFKEDTVKFTLGYDADVHDSLQKKVSFTTDAITITAVISNDENLINSVPVNNIRQRATNIYQHNIVLNKNEFLEAINRLLIFANSDNKNLKNYSVFECDIDNISLYDASKENKEKLYYRNNSFITEPYMMTLDLSDLKLILDSITDEYITLSFGNHQAVVIRRENISNIIPECKTF